MVRELEFNGSTCKMGSGLLNYAWLVLTVGQQRPWQVHTKSGFEAADSKMALTLVGTVEAGLATEVG